MGLNNKQRDSQSDLPLGAYLDSNATTPMEPEVRDFVIELFSENLGNPGSRTHEHGLRAKRLVEKARAQIATVVEAESDEVIFTSGATESNNIALLGLEQFGLQAGRKHIISSQIEHKAVLEPLELLRTRGFEVTLVSSNKSGRVDPEEIRAVLRDDTLLVSIMHVNNETGIIQPIEEICAALDQHQAYFHVDAAQGFCKELTLVRSRRIDLISATSHKIYGPPGVGALIARKRGFKRPPVKPLMVGGGQERGLRPGTLPAALLAGFGMAAEVGLKNFEVRSTKNRDVRAQALAALAPLNPLVHGDLQFALPHVINLTIPDLDSEALMVALKGTASVSNGSACTSSQYKPSHVLEAMGISEAAIKGAIRVSWGHLAYPLSWDEFCNRIKAVA